MAYLAYHFRLRCELLCIHTAQHLLQSIAVEVATSLTVSQEIAGKLEIMLPGSEICRLFNTLRQRVLKYLTTADKFGERFELHMDIDEVGDRLACELSELVPVELVEFISYLQNVSAVIGITMHGDALDWDAANIYVNTTVKIPPGALSQEYMEVNDNLRQLVFESMTRELSEEEIGRFHSLSVWQSENFLGHFRPTVFDLTGYSPSLTSLARRQNLSLCPLVTDRLIESDTDMVYSSVEHTTSLYSSTVVEETEKKDLDKDSVEIQSDLKDGDQIVQRGGSIEGHCDGEESRGKGINEEDTRDPTNDTVTDIDELESALSVLMPLSQLQPVQHQVELMIQRQHRYILGVQKDIKKLRSAIENFKPQVVVNTLNATLQLKWTLLKSATEKLDRLSSVEDRIAVLTECGKKQLSAQRLHLLPVSGLLAETLMSSRTQTSVLMELVRCVASLLSESDCYNACCSMTGMDGGLETK